MNWRTSTYSGGGQGDTCVEVAELHTRVAVRDSKAPTHAVLSFPSASFTAFVDHLKETSWRKSSHYGGGEGDSCVEIADVHPRLAIRDSKFPTRATLSFSAPAFTALIDHLKQAPWSGSGLAPNATS